MFVSLFPSIKQANLRKGANVIVKNQPCLTWNLKMMVSKRIVFLQGLIFRWTVLNFQGCIGNFAQIFFRWAPRLQVFTGVKGDKDSSGQTPHGRAIGEHTHSHAGKAVAFTPKWKLAKIRLRSGGWVLGMTRVRSENSLQKKQKENEKEKPCFFRSSSP